MAHYGIRPFRIEALGDLLSGIAPRGPCRGIAYRPYPYAEAKQAYGYAKPLVDPLLHSRYGIIGVCIDEEPGQDDQERQITAVTEEPLACADALSDDVHVAE